MENQKIILASKSPYRKELLEKLQLDFECHSADVDERALTTEISNPLEVAETLAMAKAKAVFNLHPNSIVIGSDQVVFLGNKIFHQPGSVEKAVSQLKELRGKTHGLITSVCLMSHQKTVSFYHQTQLTVRSDLTDEQIQHYVETERPLYCAGSYMIENLGISLFESVETTDFTSIIGLPLIQLTKHLKEFDVQVP